MSPRRPSSVIVIGGGIAGLASAALLAREGHSVTVLEARAEVGGRAGSWERDGFRFDTGPSWYLMPEVFDHFFRLLGTTAAENLDLVRLDPGYRVFFEKHDEAIDVHSDAETAIATFEAIEAGAGRQLRRYLVSAARTYDIAIRRFLYSTFESFGDFLHRDVLAGSGRLIRLLLQPLDRFIRGFVTDIRLRQILGYPAVFLGSSPYDAPSMYHLMSHLDLTDGVYYPRGGFTELIDAVRRLALAEGVQIRTGTTVTAITTTGYHRISPDVAVTGVRVRDAGGREHSMAASVVVAAADLHHVETELLPYRLQTYPETWWEDRVPGPGAVLLMLGVDGSLPQLAHHSLFFTDDWADNFGRIFGETTSIPDPASLYVCRPSATDPSVAPEGAENLFVLVPVPADVSIGHGGVDGAGDPRVEALADVVIEQIAHWARIPDLAARITVRRTVGPADFADDLNAWRGTSLGPAHTLRQSAFLRGRNASAKVDGLYYAGGSTIPGVGLPMCLISAELVVKRMRGDRSSGPLPEPLESSV